MNHRATQSQLLEQPCELLQHPSHFQQPNLDRKTKKKEEKKEDAVEQIECALQ